MACIETVPIESPYTKRSQGNFFLYALGRLCFKPLMYLLNWLPSSYLLPWYYSSTRAPQQKLTALPLEIITAILNELDWCDLLKVRMVCKCLNDISRTRGVWTTQYYRYAMEKKLRPRLEEPLGSYSAEELERWVLMRRSADLGWSFGSSEPPQKRWIRHHSTPATFLVQGGRWLLVGGDNGSITAYDLDVSEVSGTELIPPQGTANPQPVRWISIDIEETASKLTFTLSLSPRLPQRHAESPSLNIRIYKVTLCGHGSDAYLTACLLNSFSANEQAKVRSTSLLGRLFVRTMFTTHRNRSYIEVFDWMESTSSLHRRTTIFPQEVTACVHILPNNRLLAVSLEHLLVFNLGELDNEDPVAPAFPQTTTVPQWTVPYDGLQTCQSDCLPSFSGVQASYFVLNSGNAIHGLIIPHVSDQPPHLVELMQLPHKSVYSFIGFEKAIVEYLDGSSIDMLSFTWEQPSTTSESRSTDAISPSKPQPKGRNLRFSWQNASVVMDEETGRIAAKDENDRPSEEVADKVLNWL
ncbi:hypothetical protein Hypma_010710 [Hypsizygus marmoreus]|uniref:F-box domain-containing protein n=1 Tax=Hypsizygus marmoreus TaxID=39966 RepID=A0A369JK91_HYPMA|nr:hypothetical protein Hypma_010710 [Hypsizygus marmoreus]